MNTKNNQSPKGLRLLKRMNHKIALAANDNEIAECFPVMRELRPHLAEKDFLPQVKRLAEKTGFQMAFLRAQGKIQAVAGFRISEWLAVEGKYLEIEDLVTKNGERSNGFGGALFDWLVNFAEDNDCTHLRLVSNIARVDAHRFYERKEMTHVANYFSMNLKER